MEKLYTVSATSVGGRNGHVKTGDGIIDLDLRAPREMGGPGGAANPEMLFAAGYSACFNSALGHVARERKTDIGEPEVTVAVSIGKTEEGNFQLSAKISVRILDVTAEEAKELVETAHTVCPYSRAVKGNVPVELEIL